MRPAASPRVSSTPSPTSADARSTTSSPSSRNVRRGPGHRQRIGPARGSARSGCPRCPGSGPDTVPDASRSPVRRWAPLTVRWAICWGTVQYRPANVVRLTVSAATAPAGRRSTASRRSNAQSSSRRRYGSGGGSCAGPRTRQRAQRGERRHPGRHRGGERLAEERPERLVLPRLDVAGRPVVDQHQTEDVVHRLGHGHGPPRGRRHADRPCRPRARCRAARSARTRRRRPTRRWPAGPAHRRARHHHRARPAVVGDGQVAPVGQQRIAAGPEQPAEVRGVLDRAVEVDVVGDLDRQVERAVGHVGTSAGSAAGRWPGSQHQLDQAATAAPPTAPGRAP